MNGLEIRTSVYTNGKNAVLLTLEGYLDETNCRYLHRTVHGHTEKGRYLFGLDLAGVSYVSRVGWVAIAQEQRELQERGGGLFVAAMREPVRKIFVLSGYSSVFKSFQASEDGLRTLFNGSLPGKVRETKSVPKPRSRDQGQPPGRMFRPRGDGGTNNGLRKSVLRLVSERPYLSAGEMARELRSDRYRVRKQEVKVVLRELNLQHLRDRYELAFQHKSRGNVQ
jgi:anti-anti-sigma factor